MPFWVSLREKRLPPPQCGALLARCQVPMDAFLIKRPRDDGDGSAAPPTKASKAPVAKPAKPKDYEFVGTGAVQRLDASTLTAALAHLEQVDEPLKALVAHARGANLLVEPPSDHETFIFLCEFIVRRRIAVKAAATILRTLKEKVGGSWTPQSVIEHESDLRAYMASGESGSKVDTRVSQCPHLHCPQHSALNASRALCVCYRSTRSLMWRGSLPRRAPQPSTRCPTHRCSHSRR
jgi:hypothetical protein